MPDTPPHPPALFVAVGQQGQRIVSTDGATWKDAQLGKEGEVYRAVAYGNGRYVAVGTFGGNNIFAVTTDGVTWQTGTKDGKYRDFIRGLGFGHGGFLGIGGDPGTVGGSNPFVCTSDDGIKWGDYTPIGGKNILRRLAWGKGPDGEGLFVGVGDRGRRAASKDGLHWDDAPGVKAIDTLVDVGFGTPGGVKDGAGGKDGKCLFVGVGLNGLRMSTTDGLKWGGRVVGDEGEHLNSILWAGDRFVAVGMGATYFSPDGEKWDRRDNKDAPLAVAYGKGLFVGTNWKGRILLSDDAVAWKQVHKSDYHFEAVTFGGA